MHGTSNGGLVKYVTQGNLKAAAALRHGRDVKVIGALTTWFNIDTEWPFQGVTTKSPIPDLSPRSSTARSNVRH